VDDAGWVPIPNEQRRQAQPVPSAATIGEDGTWPLQGGRGGPCRTWPLMPDCGCLPPDATTWDTAQRQAVEAATDILWRLTGGAFGLCRQTVRPCRTPMRETWLPPTTVGPAASGMPQPALIDGQWWNLFCGCGGDTCGCGPTAELQLPGPVYWEQAHPWLPAPADTRPSPPRYDLEVWIDGQRLPETAYTLLDADRLVRTDGGTWPDCQYIDRPPRLRDDDPPGWTAEGTFAVVYWQGVPVPPAGQRAVATLACELWKACTGDDSCRLPARVQQVQREGITYSILDPQDFLQDGRTGITEVDQWLAAVNPNSLRERPSVWSPDLPRVRHQAFTGAFPQAKQPRGGGW